MTNESIKTELQLLKDNLFDDLAIYHEQVTVLVKITEFKLLESDVNFKAKVVKPLDKIFAENNPMYNHLIAQGEFSFGASYLINSIPNSSILNKNKLSRAYCSFVLWLDPELVKFVMMSDDEVTKNLPDLILWSEDWTILKKTI